MAGPPRRGAGHSRMNRTMNPSRKTRRADTPGRNDPALPGQVVTLGGDAEEETTEPTPHA